MTNIKHIGRFIATGRKCLVVFRTLPGDAFNCLVVQTENLEPGQHDALINLVETNASQNANEFAEVLARATFSDGSTMLPSLHARGLLIKVPTDKIEMCPNNSYSISLAELNQTIAQQQGVSVQDLAIKPDKKAEVKEVATAIDISPSNKSTDPLIDQLPKITEPLTDEQLAKKYRADADALSKEAASLRKMAEELVPTKKKNVTV